MSSHLDRVRLASAAAKRSRILRTTKSTTQASANTAHSRTSVVDASIADSFNPASLSHCSTASRMPEAGGKHRHSDLSTRQTKLRASPFQPIGPILRAQLRGTNCYVRRIASASITRLGRDPRRFVQAVVAARVESRGCLPARRVQRRNDAMSQGAGSCELPFVQRRVRV